CFEVLSIDVGFPEPNVLTRSQGHIYVSRINRRSKPIFRVICKRYSLVQIIESNNWNYRPEYFTTNNVHVLATACQHRWLIKKSTLKRSPSPSIHKSCACFYGCFHKFVDFEKAPLVN